MLSGYPAGTAVDSVPSLHVFPRPVHSTPDDCHPGADLLAPVAGSSRKAFLPSGDRSTRGGVCYNQSGSRLGTVRRVFLSVSPSLIRAPSRLAAACFAALLLSCAARQVRQ